MWPLSTATSKPSRFFWIAELTSIHELSWTCPALEDKPRSFTPLHSFTTQAFPSHGCCWSAAQIFPCAPNFPVTTNSPAKSSNALLWATPSDSQAFPITLPTPRPLRCFASAARRNNVDRLWKLASAEVGLAHIQ